MGSQTIKVNTSSKFILKQIKKKHLKIGETLELIGLPYERYRKGLIEKKNLPPKIIDKVIRYLCDNDNEIEQFLDLSLFDSSSYYYTSKTNCNLKKLYIKGWNDIINYLQNKPNANNVIKYAIEHNMLDSFWEMIFEDYCKE